MSVNTTKMSYYNGSSYVALSNAYTWNGSSWDTANLIWRFDGTNWIIRYSTPSVTCPDVSGSNSGNSSSGLVTSAAAAPVLGGHYSASLSYFWTFISGDSGITISSFTSLAPTWSKIESTSSSAVWQLTVVDNFSGASTTVNITVTLTWTNTTAAIAVTGINASGSYEVSEGPISGVTVSTGIGGSVGGCNPSGGNGDYTFAWTYVSGDAAITPDHTNVHHPVWSKSMSAAGGTTTTATAVWQISLSDTNSDGPVTANITITLSAISDNAYPTLAVSGVNAAGVLDIGTFEGTYCTTVPTTTGGCNPNGGNGSYNYSWTYVSGNSSISPNNAFIQNPTWSSYMCVSPGTAPVVISATWQISITDTAGNGPVTTNITVQLTLTADHIYPTLSVTGEDAYGLAQIGYYVGTYCTTVSTGSGGPAGGAFPSGGSGIYNYNWVFVSGDNTQTISSTTAKSPTWDKNLCTNAGDSPATSDAVWRCSVTDSAGFGPVTCDINVHIELDVLNGP